MEDEAEVIQFEDDPIAARLEAIRRTADSMGTWSEDKEVRAILKRAIDVTLPWLVRPSAEVVTFSCVPGVKVRSTD
jgi:hypothetical protein